MEINTALVNQLAHLSRLHFDDAGTESVRADLEKILGFVEKLEELDTTGIEPLMHMGDTSNVLREDKVKGSVTREEALLNSPATDSRFFKVPKVIRK